MSYRNCAANVLWIGPVNVARNCENTARSAYLSDERNEGFPSVSNATEILMSGKTHLHESKLYHDLAKWYERVFERFFGKRILSTLAGLDIPNDARILELGVGTGLSLSAYPSHCHVDAIDLSQSMLREAASKATNNGWDHICLRQMDATNLDFPDDHFDFVHAFHLVTVVPDHQKLLSEMLRVCKPGGTLVVINHFQSPRRWISMWVNLVDPITRPLGWRTTLSLEQFFGDAKLRVAKRFKTSWRSLFTVVIAKKEVAVAEPTRRRPRTTQLA
jgi:phosphatidylethanolamine/phosphatidyl-N-methylethanolamine N-methyltransferase